MELQVEKEQNSPVEYSLKVTVPAHEMSDRLESRMSTVAQSASIPGFRKGKIPRKILIQKFGDAITQEALQEVLQSSYQQALEDQKLDPVTPGEMSEIKFEQGQPLTYQVRLETMPNYDLPDFSAITVPLLKPEITDEDVATSIDGMREGGAVLTPTDDPVAEDSLITVDLQELDDTGVPIVGKSEKDLDIDMRRPLFGEDFASKVIGLSCEETAIFQLRGHPDEEGQKRDQKIQATIRNIQRKELPEVNDDFARSLNPNVSGLDELREDLRRYLQARADFSARQRMYREMADEILKHVDFPVPPRMLDDYLDRMAADGVKSAHEKPDPEKLKEFKENYHASAVWNLRWYILRSRIIREQDLKVVKAEFRAEVARLAAIEQTSPEDYENRLTAEQRHGINDDLMERKVFAFLEEKVDSNPTPISLAEFEGRAEKKIVTT